VYMNDKDWFGSMIILAIIVGLVGWGVIEGVIWIVHHINFSWGE
jgi:hypothetical protein